MLSLETQLNQAFERIGQLTGENIELKNALHQERLLHAQVTLEERIEKLSPASQERLRKAFPGTDLGGLRQAINVERRGVV